ncbi:MAG: DinB family protein [Gloeobacteraceae cyanobacterium ES-bin-316]|nr:DinB family protein [Ferruginibacter sp.]
MALAQDLLNELIQEGAVTRRYLERVPFEKAAFKPHQNSETLGRLAIHVAEIIAWWKECLLNDELDFINFEPRGINTAEQLLLYFDDLLAEAIAILAEAKSEDFEKKWSMRHGEDILFTLPKKQVLRTFCMNHLVHHRAQLGVYLRILNVPVPATYGPSADDDDVLLIDLYP